PARARNENAAVAAVARVGIVMVSSLEAFVVARPCARAGRPTGDHAAPARHRTTAKQACTGRSALGRFLDTMAPDHHKAAAARAYRSALFGLPACQPRPQYAPATGRSRPGPIPFSAAHGTNTRTKMFAVIRTGGKQYRVAAEDVIKVDKVKGEPGEIVE